MDWFRLSRALVGRGRSADHGKGTLTVTGTAPVPTPLVWGARVRVTAAGVRAGIGAGSSGIYLGKDVTRAGQIWVVRVGAHTASHWPATYWEVA